MAEKTSPKERTLKLVERLSDDVSFDEIIYELYVLEQIQQGIEEIHEGKTQSHEQVGRDLDAWLK